MKRHEAAVAHKVDKHRAIKRKRNEDSNDTEIIFKVIRIAQEVLAPAEERKS